MTCVVRTQVAVVGAGPAGLVLANVLHQAGIGVCLLERESRSWIEQRARAGLLEHRVVAYLREQGLADRLLAEARRHGRCDIKCLGERVPVHYADFAGGAHHWIYPQQELVRDLIGRLVEAGCPPRFEQGVTAVEPSGGGRPRVRTAGLDVECDYVVGCDGVNGRVAQSVPGDPGDTARYLSRRYPYDWLTVLAEVARPVDEVLYCVNEAGFAGIMPRSGDMARLYLQVAPDDDLGRWSHKRIMRELVARLEPGACRPRVVRVVESGMLRMRSRVCGRLRYGRVFLAGDSAHLLTPSGAKGMNLAIADAADLGQALIAALGSGDTADLDGYSARRIDAAWQAQSFSEELLHLLHLPEGTAQERQFALRLRLARIRRIAEPGPEATAFAHAYAGFGSLPARPTIAATHHSREPSCHTRSRA
ncbi:4-hydroxybenzoate 3-monooxygenase [Streptomyces roseifaciens]|uniref:4-hydroxybenzoate 3-monooxygenase n=1 Tax=Streptomyces roseifaciens TaxID=1488406 RepID=UPI0007C74A00|nr:4-hydroxybenzoate 3-monooxygenase [Streptomyces roseifaciens]